MSVATKLMIQISAKLGGEPWRVKVPTTVSSYCFSPSPFANASFQGWMIAGYDTYHDARQKAVGAFVASLNQSFSKYYSKATIHDNNEKIAPNFYEYMVDALK